MLFSEYTELGDRDKRSFFAGANGSGGFRGYYDSVFSCDKYKKIFILKGGPGTGKSSLMKTICDNVKNDADFIEYIYCASDCDSLDGVIIHSKKRELVAILDGTAPHVRDTEIPGACDEIINLGEFWESAILEKRRSEIEELIELKKDGFTRAYRYLAAADGLNSEIKRMTSKAFDMVKMKSACDRITKQTASAKSGDIEFRLIEAITMSGAVRLESFELMAEKQYRIIEAYECAHIILDEILRQFAGENNAVYVSHSPLNSRQINALYLPEQGVSFIVTDERADGTANSAGSSEEAANFKYINADRFIDGDRIAKIRQRYRFAVKCRSAMLSGAQESLVYAGKHHFELESIYKAAMNFRKSDVLIGELTETIYSYL